ncbi:hypothetical protein NQ315_009222 [Exocentrus adspersus]|uniref:Ras-related protein Rab-8A n=1 Tax=Exocentrus adspersus TaxID=1586481 RepID=A0AAV8WF67_9CUCU|nr:hypothetical protein NQ315_009222 [Exocentrus adspersus]
MSQRRMRALGSRFGACSLGWTLWWHPSVFGRYQREQNVGLCAQHWSVLTPYERQAYWAIRPEHCEAKTRAGIEKERNIDRWLLYCMRLYRDTAGQERFRTITTAYYRGAMGIMLVYDITNEKSFENIKNWIRNIEENASADVEKMLLGNKCELEEKRQVSKERGEQLAIEYGIKFIETSAKASIRVEEAFFTLARDIKAKMEKKLEASNPPKGGHQLRASEPQKKTTSWLSRCTIL